MGVLVLGVGNVLLGDEGIGVHVVRELEARYVLPGAVEVVDGGTSGMDLLDVLASRERVIIVDAVKTGDPPGTLVRLRNDRVRRLFRARISPHQLGLSDLLATLALMDREPEQLLLLGAVPCCLDTGLSLSPLLSVRREDLLRAVVAELSGLGLDPAHRGAPLETPAAGLTAGSARRAPGSGVIP